MSKKNNAQGSLEYLIIIAAVLAIAALVILFVTGSFGASKSSADISKCKAAASKCGVEKATSQQAPCTYCESACPKPLWDECKQGEAASISSIECKKTSECNQKACNLVSCTSDGYCEYTAVENGTECNQGICCGGSCSNVCSSNADCNDFDSCTADSCVNPGTCDAQCVNEKINICKNDDGCCAEGCNVNNDNDCPIKEINAWVLSGKESYHSLNEGEWEKNLTSSLNLIALDFLNESDGIVSTNRNTYYYTQNSGGGWVQKKLSSQFSNILLTNVKLLNKAYGLFGGSLQSHLGQKKKYFFLNKINSVGGDRQPFSTKYLKQTENMTVNDIDILTPEEAWVVFEDTFGNNNQIIKVNLKKLKAETNKIVNSPLYSVDFVSAEKGFVGGKKILLETTDSGNTWQEVSSLKGYNFRDISFFNETTGWLLSNRKIFKTVDGGSDWAMLSFSPPSGSFTKIYFINATNGWVGTDKGYLYKTTDGGDTWVDDNFPGTGSINDMKFVIS